MNILKQIKAELKNLLNTRFILVIGIIVLIMAVATPIITYVTERYYEGQNNMYGATATMYYGDSNMEGIIVDGVEITPDNPFYYDIYNYSQDYVNYLPVDITDTQREYIDETAEYYLSYYVKYAAEVNSYDDFRYDLVYRTMGKVLETYMLEANPTDEKDFMEAVSYVFYVDYIEDLMGLSEDEKAEEIATRKAFIEQADSAIMAGDFNSYADCMIEVCHWDIEEYKTAIEVQEAAVIANPDLEESANAEIERLEQQIATVEESTIPTWEYRKENQIYPNSDEWQNYALNQIEYATYDLKNSLDVMEEKDFIADIYQVQTYGTYEKYLQAMELKALKAQSDILVAQNSLDSGEPDMQFVKEGARNKVNSNLVYSVIVAVLGILIGGYVIANEFQSGTVRLLMIRPRTRGKVYGSKFAAGLIYLYGIYFIGMFANILVNGMLSGFADYGYPNYTASGEVNFWGMIIGRILICSITIIFSYSLAYAASTIIRNSAIAIALPSAAIFGGMIATSILMYTRFAKYLAYTPLPYLNFANLFSEYGVANSLLNKGITLNNTLGVVMLLVLSIVCYVLGLLSLKKLDITN